MSREYCLTYRHRARRVIVRVLEQLGPWRQLKERRRALRAAYPFGARRGYGYRVWLDEVRVNLGLQPPRRKYCEPLVDSPGQKLLFE